MVPSIRTLLLTLIIKICRNIVMEKCIHDMGINSAGKNKETILLSVYFISLLFTEGRRVGRSMGVGIVGWMTPNNRGTRLKLLHPILPQNTHSTTPKTPILPSFHR